MARQVLLGFAFLLVLNLSLVLCKEDLHHQFSNIFSHHHRKSTPGESVVPTEATSAVTEGDKNVIQHGYTIIYDGRVGYEDDGTVRIVSIVVSLVLMVIGLIIIFVCGKKIGRKVTTGHIVNRAQGVQPPQAGFVKPYP